MLSVDFDVLVVSSRTSKIIDNVCQVQGKLPSEVAEATPPRQCDSAPLGKSGKISRQRYPDEGMTNKKENEGFIRAAKDITAGSVGGIAQVLTGQPFDIVKVNTLSS